MKRTGFKRKRPYTDPREKRIRDSASGEDCTLRFELVCRNDTTTTVYCHSNKLVDGKGAGLKAGIGCYGCYHCHEVLDGRAPRPSHLTYEAMIDRFYEACAETQEKLLAKGLLK